MPESFIQLPKDGTGKKTRTIKIIKDGHEVHQQVVQITDKDGNIINASSDDSLLLIKQILEQIKLNTDNLQNIGVMKYDNIVGGFLVNIVD